MSRLPPVEKLPLALRKNVRDEWDSKKPDLEKELSEILTVPWTIDINPNQIYAYATDGYAKDSTGSCIAAYVKGAIYQLKQYADNFGDDGVKELNTICRAHALTMDVDLEKRFNYGGVDVDDEGALRICFAQKNLGVNVDYCLEKATLLDALNKAPAAPASSDGAAGSMSFSARTAVRQDYEPKIEEIRKRIAELLAKEDIVLNPNFEDTYARLKEESQVKKTELRKDWESSMGSYAISYFEGLISQLQWQKFEDDELLQEGFHEVVDKGDIAYRIVDKLKYDSYCECEIEDGVLYLQSTAKTWGTNATYAAQKLVDKL